VQNFRKNAFTMIELVFVIVVLGILAAVAIPKFAATRTDAQISKGRADVSSIRSGIISDRQVRLITGDPKFIEAGNNAGQLDAGAGGVGTGPLFGGVLSYPVADSYWKNVSRDDENSSTYTFTSGGTSTTFTYTRGDGKFTCSTTAGTAEENELCKKLIN
jgi:general secretion pathway protein G